MTEHLFDARGKTLRCADTTCGDPIDYRENEFWYHDMGGAHPCTHLSCGMLVEPSEYTDVYRAQGRLLIDESDRDIREFIRIETVSEYD